MFNKKCACGKSSKNFRRDIGPFYVTDCCTQAGYDHLGNKNSESGSDLNLKPEVETVPNPSDHKENAPTERVPTKEENLVKRMKRVYNRGGNIKKPLSQP